MAEQTPPSQTRPLPVNGAAPAAAAPLVSVAGNATRAAAAPVDVYASPLYSATKRKALMFVIRIYMILQLDSALRLYNIFDSVVRRPDSRIAQYPND